MGQAKRAWPKEPDLGEAPAKPTSFVLGLEGSKKGGTKKNKLKGKAVVSASMDLEVPVASRGPGVFIFVIRTPMEVEEGLLEPG